MARLEVIAADVTAARGGRHHERREHGAAPRWRRGGRDLARGRPEVQRESDERAPIGLGDAVETTAGDMPARWVIHAATMELGGPTSADDHRAATRSTLAKAEELGARSLALVAFGTGVGGFPIDGGRGDHGRRCPRARGSPRADRVRGARRRRPSARSARRFDLPVLVAPDSFKGTFSAPEVAAAIASGLRSAGREAHELPVADGGEGTMDVLVSALGGEVRTATVLGSARAAGRGALRAATGRERGGGDGAGERTLAGARGRARRVGGIHARHGRADRGGRGGGRLTGDRDGGRLGDNRRGRGCGRGIEGGGFGRRPRAPRAPGSCLCTSSETSGSFEDAPRIFGPQKGADPAMVERLERDSTSWPRASRAIRAACR